MGSVLVCLSCVSRGRVRSAVCNALLPNRGDSGAARQLSCRECAATWHIIRMPPSGNSLDYSFETRRLQARAIRYAANALPLCSMGACGCEMSYLYHRHGSFYPPPWSCRHFQGGAHLLPLCVAFIFAQHVL